jgi:CheY-like chemotaxis protein
VVLIVDDNADMRALMIGMIRAEGFEATAVGDGESALRFIEEHQPSCIVLDISMPDISGLDVLRTIRASDKYGRPKVVMFSALSHEHRDLAMAAGADGYVVKGSLDWLNIVNLIEKWCSRSQSSSPPSNRNDRDVC